MPATDLASTVIKMRPFFPAKDFEVSKRFYEDLGFSVRLLDPGLAEMSFGAQTFLLQNYYVPEWAGNFMMHLLLTDLDRWWKHIASLDLAGRYGVPPPKPPKLESWGLNVAYVIDPSSVLWHFAEVPAKT